MKTRADREQVWWNEAYRPAGVHHSHFSWMEYQEEVSYTSNRFEQLAHEQAGKRILSLGGGVDRLAVSLAESARRVVSVDISPVAGEATLALARQVGVAERLTVLVGTAEEVPLDRESFDLVICKRALHHMELNKVVPRVHALLAREGVFLALEPICLLQPLRWIHDHFPFYPYGMTDDERMLTHADLAAIRKTFREIEVSYHDFLTRESIAVLLCWARLGRLQRPLGRLDSFLLNHLLPWLKPCSEWLIIRARK